MLPRALVTCESELALEDLFFKNKLIFSIKETTEILRGMMLPLTYKIREIVLLKFPSKYKRFLKILGLNFI